MANLSDLFIGDPNWRRPTHGANRCVVLAGTSCCICVPSTATRVVIEMWGQGGGGAGAQQCTWGWTGGQGGSYGSKVWEGDDAPAATSCCITFCGCVCACDCRVPIGNGHPGQFSRLTSCSTGNPTVGGWIGCVNGGVGGQVQFLNFSWPCCSCKCNPGYDIQCVGTGATGLPDAYHIACMSTAQNSACSGGSMVCCVASACYCATGLCSATCAGFQHRVNEVCVVGAAGSDKLTFDQIFPKVNCACFDNYRLGACGWSKAGTPYFTSCTIWNWCDIGVGGAAYAGGCQEKRNFSLGSWAYCGFAGNLPGGGGKSSGACGGGCCSGSIGGPGLILVSWDT
jgi:hypothetical protein